MPEEPPRRTNRRSPCPAQSLARTCVKDTGARQELSDHYPETDKIYQVSGKKLLSSAMCFDRDVMINQCCVIPANVIALISP